MNQLPPGRPVRTAVQRYQHLPVERVHFGIGSIAKLADEAQAGGYERIFVIASRSLSEATGDLAPVREVLGDRIAEVYREPVQHCPIDAVLAAAARARAVGADLLLTVGGSSLHDLARGVALCVAEGIEDVDALRARRVRFTFPDHVEMPEPIPSPPLPIVCVPTTLSAGETTSGFGITNRDGNKDIYFFSQLTPTVVVYDPGLTVHTPEQLWLSTGMRAVDHCVESLYSPTAQPVTDALCSDALWRLARHLPRSRQDPGDLATRLELQTAAWMSYFGLGNAMSGVSHALGHAVGARFGVPHGITSCTILPAAMAWNAPETAPAQDRIAAIVADATGASAELGAPELIRRLVASLGLPTRLGELGLERDDLAEAADLAINDMLLPANPRQVGSRDDLLEILTAAH